MRAASSSSSTTRSRARTCSVPIEFGADLVVHSTTKFPQWHSDSVGGAVIAVRDDHIEWLQFVQNTEGAILGPMDAWLVLRGTKTLPIRMERHNANAQVLAEFLASHVKVRRVHYPGLPSHPQHELGAQANARVRRPHRIRSGIVRERAKVIEQRPVDGIGRESWRCRNADRSPGDDDARIGPTGETTADRHY
jgi:O-acetylhomoserine/O-acetylserine sulfhydrylase-like pyridoxal-dependent enzyme